MNRRQFLIQEYLKQADAVREDMNLRLFFYDATATKSTLIDGAEANILGSNFANRVVSPDEMRNYKSARHFFMRQTNEDRLVVPPMDFALLKHAYDRLEVLPPLALAKMFWLRTCLVELHDENSAEFSDSLIKLLVDDHPHDFHTWRRIIQPLIPKN